MTAPTRNILVTGGAGFIGSAVCRLLLKSGSNRVVVVDKLTYAGNLASLEPVSARANFRFELCDIADEARIARLLQDERIDCVMHLAAETHVDRSLREPDAFIATNIVGTFHLLQAVLSYWRGLDDQARAGFRFHHVSTDEVFGGAPDGEPSLLSELRYRPSSPYSGTWTMSIGGGNCMTRQRPDRSPRPPAPRGIGHHAPGHPCNELTCHLCRKPLDGRTAICLHQLDRERMAAPSSEARFSGSDSGRRANERAAPGRPCAIRRLGVAHVPEHLRL